MHAFAKKLATYVYWLNAASAVEQWEQDHKGKRHPLNPGPGGRWDDTLPDAPDWLAKQARRLVVEPLLKREGCRDDVMLAAKFPDYRRECDTDALAWNLANWCTGDGGADWKAGGPRGSCLFGYLDVHVGPTSVRLRRPRQHPAQ